MVLNGVSFWIKSIVTYISVAENQGKRSHPQLSAAGRGFGPLLMTWIYYCRLAISRGFRVPRFPGFEKKKKNQEDRKLIWCFGFNWSRSTVIMILKFVLWLRETRDRRHLEKSRPMFWWCCARLFMTVSVTRWLGCNEQQLELFPDLYYLRVLTRAWGLTGFTGSGYGRHENLLSSDKWS